MLAIMHRKIISGRRNREDKTLIDFFKKYIKPQAAILDVGCGLGHNLDLLKNIGYINAVGTDISEEMLACSRVKGNLTCTFQELENAKKRFDVILFSHVLEHIEYRDIQKTLEAYFNLAKENAFIIVCMPVLYDGFYNDVDHIKPYYPKGLSAMFSDAAVPRQYGSRFRLSLIDLRYLKTSLVPYHLRSRHIRNAGNYLILGTITFIFFLLRILTMGLASKTTSYIAIFQLKNPLR